MLLCKHSDEGAFGLVVNRPLVTTGRVVVNLDPPVSTERELRSGSAGRSSRSAAGCWSAGDRDDDDETVRDAHRRRAVPVDVAGSLRRLLEPIRRRARA